MTSESTPLTKGNLMKAGDFISEKATGLSDSVLHGNSTPLRILTILGGLAMLVSSVMSLLGKVVILDLIGVFMECLCAALGVLIILLEANDKLPVPLTGFEEFIETRCKFLESMKGKAYLYGLSGILKVLMIDLNNLIVGLFMFFLAFVAYTARQQESNYSEMISIAV